MELGKTSATDLPLYLRKEEPSQELKNLIASLPSQSDWIDVEMLHLYQGFWYSTRILNSVIACQNQFQARDSDLLLVTPPKAGTTWTKALVFSIINRMQYKDNTERHPLLEKSPHDLVFSLELDLYLTGHARVNESDFKSPRVFSTHLPYVSLPKSVEESSCKIIYMGRNPKDNLISLWQFMNKLKHESVEGFTLEQAFVKFCNGITPFGPLWEHLLEYWYESLKRPEKVLFLKFEEMKEKPGDNVRRIAEFLGCPFSAEEERRGGVDDILKLCSFEHLSRLKVNQSGEVSNGLRRTAFFRKGEVGDWANYLTPEMAEQIDCITEEKLSGSGLRI